MAASSPPHPSVGFTAAISPMNPNSPSNQKNNDGNGMIPSILHDQFPSPSIKPPSLNSPVVNGASMSSPPPHMSTPPGPPLFSSPIHPASHPVRSSPVSPQPPTFSSPPPPLLPQCSNGSAELQHNDSYIIDGSNIAGDSPFVLFSASKVLKQKKKANVASLGFGALVSPGRDVPWGPQIVRREPQRCHNCGAFANVYCNILLGSGQWQCVICRSLNGSDGEYIASGREELRSFPELSSPAVDYVRTGKKTPGLIPMPAAPVVVVVDECLDEPHLRHLQTSLHAFVDSLPSTTRLGVLLYSRTVSVFDLSENLVASADVVPGSTSPPPASLKALIYGDGVYLAPLRTCISIVHKIISSLRHFPFGTAEALRDRCLGASVEVALALIKGPSMELDPSMTGSRVIVCAGGPNTYGPGSVPHSFDHPNYPYMEKTASEWMKRLGRDAYRHNTAVDILCAGACPVRTSILHPLTAASGGVLLLHDDFGEGFGANLQRASSRSSGWHGVMEARCSDEISITQVVGPGEEASSSDSNEVFKNDAAFAIRMPSVEGTQSFSFSMEARRDIKADFVYFQFAVDYTGSHRADISRVVTVRLPTVDSISAYLRSVQVEVAAVLAAKRTLLRAKNPSDSAVMREAIDERIKDMALKFGSKLPKSDFRAFPKELCLLPEYLFHLRRGPLLGSVIGHEDERSVLRNLFLNGSFDLSLRMMAPRCLMHREAGTFEELPAYDLAMQSGAAVVLDHGTHIFIWISAELANDGGRSASALAACRTLAEELGEFRFPAPRILDFKEGSSEARYFMPRLIPAHKDPSYEQEARFPQIRSLSTEQRTHLIRKFIHFDDPSFCEWMRSLKATAPVAM